MFKRPPEPPTAVLVKFIDAYKGRFGVAPICRVLTEHGIKIAPPTFYDARDRAVSQRRLRDEDLKSRPLGYTVRTTACTGRARCGCSLTVRASRWPGARWND